MWEERSDPEMRMVGLYEPPKLASDRYIKDL